MTKCQCGNNDVPAGHAMCADCEWVDQNYPHLTANPKSFTETDAKGWGELIEAIRRTLLPEDSPFPAMMPSEGLWYEDGESDTQYVLWREWSGSPPVFYVGVRFGGATISKLGAFQRWVLDQHQPAVPDFPNLALAIGEMGSADILRAMDKNRQIVESAVRGEIVGDWWVMAAFVGSDQHDHMTPEPFKTKTDAREYLNLLRTTTKPERIVESQPETFTTRSIGPVNARRYWIEFEPDDQGEAAMIREALGLPYHATVAQVLAKIAELRRRGD